MGSIAIKITECFAVAILALLGSGCGSMYAANTDPNWRDTYLKKSRCSKTYSHLRKVTTGRYSNLYGPDNPDAYTSPWNYTGKTMGVRTWDMLGDVYYHGCADAGVVVDRAEAAKWYKYGSLAHIPESQFKLGRMLYEGDGIPQNKGQGLKWLVSAAKEKSSKARSYLSALGHDVQSGNGPNTYETMAEKAKKLSAAEWARFWGDVGDAVVFGIEVAASGYLASEIGARALGTPDKNNDGPRSAPLKNVKFVRPVYCSSNIQGYQDSNLVSATISTFCY